MEEPEITQHPTEVFGYSFINRTSEAQTACEQQYCPFLQGECKKPRKSEPEVKVGICSVGYKGKFLEKMTPIIVCPHRLREENVYHKIGELYFGSLPNEYQIKWASEVSCGVAGSIDFVAAKMKEGVIEDFLCVEFQAAGTTGTPWQAVLDLKQDGRFNSTRYKYGINWANEFTKTMMQQAYKKGMVIQSWQKKIVFVIQNVGLDYIQSTTDTSGLHDARDEDSIHFCMFKTVWNKNRNAWQLEFDKRMSTDTEGVRRMLGGAPEESHPTIDEFKNNLHTRLQLNSETYGEF